MGAGIAGLRVGRRLAEAGIDVQLFDKARGAGGRVSTRRTEQGPFDHGAQYFTARDPRFRRVVEAWHAAGVVAPWAGRFVRVSARGEVSEVPPAERFVGLPGMSGIARALRGDLPIELGVRVASAQRTDAGWALRCDAGFELGEFDRLVVAVPAPQAVPLLGRAPRLARVARAARMRPCHAVLVCFASRIPVGFDGAFIEGRALGWAARNAAKPGREGGECWVLHTDAEWSEEHVDTPPDKVETVLLDDLRDALDVGLPRVQSISTHRWLFARAVAVPETEVWDASLGLGICGDWLVGDRVEDAFLSGEALADAILADRGV